MRFSFMRLTILVSLCFGMSHHCGFVQTVKAAAVEPLKVLIVAGGCCHDYATQTKLLKNGIEERINASVEIIYNPDTSTEARFEIYESDLLKTVIKIVVGLVEGLDTISEMIKSGCTLQRVLMKRILTTMNIQMKTTQIEFPI